MCRLVMMISAPRPLRVGNGYVKENKRTDCLSLCIIVVIISFFSVTILYLSYLVILIYYPAFYLRDGSKVLSCPSPPKCY